MTKQGISVSIFVVVLLAIGGFFVFGSKPVVEKIDNTNPPADGTGRIAAGYVSGHITIGPNCPGPQRDDASCPTPPGAYSSRSVIVYESDKTTVNVTGKIDAEGNYKIALGPGNYFVQISPAGIGAGEKKPITIVSFKTTTLDFDIDTGMR
jgi:hypothetical protein